jgi:AsmA family protein
MAAMNGPLVLRRSLMGAATVLAVLLTVIAGFIVGVDAGYFRGALIAYLERRTDRQISIAGPFHAHLFSSKPRLIAENVSIGNPIWTPPGIAAEIGKVSVAFDMPRWGHSFRINSLQLERATLHLYRDAAGHANWQRRNPDQSATQALPLISSLSVPGARVFLDDERRHLKFDGQVSALGAAGAGAGAGAEMPTAAAPLRIEGSGQLNGKAVSFELKGDPLATATHEQPYHFSFTERGTDSQLHANGLLPQPFDFSVLQAGFEAQGANLKDLYYLTGVTLVNTGDYRLSGKFARRATLTLFSDLCITSGTTEVRGSVSIEDSSGRPMLNAKLIAPVLHMADFGARADRRSHEPPPAEPLLLSNTVVNLQAMRRGDAVVHFQAQRVEVGRIALQDFSAQLSTEHGVLTAAPVSAEVLGGRLAAHIKIDATQEVPKADIDLSIANLQLAQVHRNAGPAAIEGPLQLRLAISGRGNSIHEVAATARGSAGAQLAQGTVRTSLAEMTGIDLRGLGLLLEKDKQETSIRCGAAHFSAHEGIFSVQDMVLDTQPVLIRGEGQIQMQAETLDIMIRGEPKSMRILRLRTPVLVRGTLSHPSIGIQKRDSKLVLVDRGRAQDQDCGALVK